MMQISGIIQKPIKLIENSNIVNCFFCNFIEATLLSTAKISLRIDSCLFEENYNYGHGGAINIAKASNMSVIRCFGKSCCTKSENSESRYGQFCFITIEDTESNRISFIDSSLSSCAPFLEKDDRRSVVELFYGKISISNINFSNNMANSQILRTQSMFSTDLSFATFFQSFLTNDLILRHDAGRLTISKTHFIANTLNSDSTFLDSYDYSTSYFLDCSFRNCTNYVVMPESNCNIVFESCYFDDIILKKGFGDVTFIGKNLTVSQSTLKNPEMREVVENVLVRGFCATSNKRKSFLIGMLFCFVISNKTLCVYMIFTFIEKTWFQTSYSNYFILPENFVLFKIIHCTSKIQAMEEIRIIFH